MNPIVPHLQQIMPGQFLRDQETAAPWAFRPGIVGQAASLELWRLAVHVLRSSRSAGVNKSRWICWLTAMVASLQASGRITGWAY